MTQRPSAAPPARRASYSARALRPHEAVPDEPVSQSPAMAATGATSGSSATRPIVQSAQPEAPKKKPVPHLEAASSDTDESGHTWKRVTAEKPARQRAHGLSYADDSAPLFVKLAFVGNSGVGKTALVHHFSSPDELRRFSLSGGASTVGADYKEVWIKTNHPHYNRLTKLSLVDTAGQERFRSITPQMFSAAQGVALVFDATSQESLTAIEQIWQPLVRDRNQFCVMALVATKYDLYITTGCTWMDKLDMQNIARQLGCDAGFHVTSAKSHIHVEATIVMLADIAIAKERMMLDLANSTAGGGADASVSAGGDVLVLVDRSVNNRRTDCNC
jgi:small GTP-binding protein